MKTWLDAFLTGHLRNVQAIPQLAANFKAAGQVPRDDFDAMRMGCLLDYQAYQRGMRIPMVQGGIITLTVAQLAFLRIASDKSGPTTVPSRAVQPAMELVETLVHARAPARDTWRSAIEDVVWYIDLPHRALMVGPLHEVRAILTCPFDGEIWINAILTKPNSDQLVGRVCWRVAEARTDTNWKPVDPRLVAFGGTMHFGDMPGPDDMLASGGIPTMDAGYFRDSVEDLVGLIVLFETVGGSDDAATYLPQKSREECRRTPSILRPTFSLFKVRRLEVPADRFGRPDTGRKGSWTLDIRQQVEGHFKMQPYGPGRMLRKLIWVAGYERGPEDGRVRSELEEPGIFHTF
ncbi:hypothetical protein JL100_030415 (plasmid) [Skermanella mucosa]|uniref:hypothetical protein n=1 Tax=Skermanella mucosa TaxID=1789672 RepID=UPI00192C5330|nr:hypothetical protein [Skermanella mucosa]UEM24539.1 hypothetical protein JL100_030415 [Skermanella mucosa]